MNILITGGAGFIGSHLSEYYVSKGYNVLVIDNLSTGSIKNIRKLKESKNFRLLVEDIRESRVLYELIDEADIIFHLAAAVGVKLIVESPVNTIENNVHSTEIILSIASKKKKKVIFASTSEVYGCLDKVPYEEDDFLLIGNPQKGRWSYACSKLLDEFLVLSYYKERKLPAVIVRLFNTVGPRQTGRYGMVLPTFVKQALSNSDITVFGDGTQTRTFTHVKDVIKALGKIADSDRCIGEIINIGGVEEISIYDLAKRVKKITGSKSKIVFIPYDKAYEKGFEDMYRRVPSIKKAERLIQYSPENSLEDIIRDVMNYIKKEGD